MDVQGNLTNLLREFKIPKTEDIENIHQYIFNNLSPYRYEHSLQVLDIAAHLAIKNHVEHDLIQKIFVAALAHDITKEQPAVFHKNIFKKYNVEHYGDQPEPLYHSRSAVLFLLENFHIQDPVISHAIFNHSTGCESMPLFSRIIFCADYIASQNHDNIEETINKNLTDLCLDKITSTLSYLVNKKLPVQPESINFYNKLIYESWKRNETANAE